MLRGAGGGGGLWVLGGFGDSIGFEVGFIGIYRFSLWGLDRAQTSRLFRLGLNPQILINPINAKLRP